MTKTPSVGTSAKSGAESRSGLVSNCSIIWNSESSAGTMLELELVMPSSTNDRNALHTQNLMKLGKCHPLASRCLLVSSPAQVGCCAAPHHFMYIIDLNH